MYLSGRVGMTVSPSLAPRASERRKRVSTVCTCTYYPMISWGIVYHRQQTVYILCYTNLCESADFPNLKDVCHQPCSLKTMMRREYGKPRTPEQPEQAEIRSLKWQWVRTSQRPKMNQHDRFLRMSHWGIGLIYT